MINSVPFAHGPATRVPGLRARPSQFIKSLLPPDFGNVDLQTVAFSKSEQLCEKAKNKT